MPKRSSKKIINRQVNRRQTIAALTLVVFAVAGLVGLAISRAATGVVTVEAETGIKTGNAIAGPTAGASGGASVKFNAAATGGGCALPNFPNETCTGVPAGTQLTVDNAASTVIRDNNTVIENKDFRGCVSVQAINVTIKKSKITCSGNGVNVFDLSQTIASNLTIEDSEIVCTGTSNNGISGTNATVRRVNIRGCFTGISLLGKAIIQDNYIHSLQAATGTAMITGGIRVGGTAAGNRIEHNTVVHSGNAQAMIAATEAGYDGVVANNLVAGGQYGLRCAFSSSSNPSKLQVTGNRFSTRFFPTVGSIGPWNECTDEASVSGNVYHETGQAL